MHAKFQVWVLASSSINSEQTNKQTNKKSLSFNIFQIVSSREQIVFGDFLEHAENNMQNLQDASLMAKLYQSRLTSLHDHVKNWSLESNI